MTAATVPRRASFDDLRVGMWVGVLAPNDGLWGGCISARSDASNGWRVVDVDGNRTGYLDKAICEFCEVTILRDVPSPPVTVRREDYETLREALTISDRFTWQAARALIDNADLGADS